MSEPARGIDRQVDHLMEFFDRSALGRSNCRSLAKIITDLVNANEPLLRAQCDGATVTVAERGGPSSMTFTVEQPREAGDSNKAPASNS